MKPPPPRVRCVCSLWFRKESGLRPQASQLEFQPSNDLDVTRKPLYLRFPLLNDDLLMTTNIY